MAVGDRPIGIFDSGVGGLTVLSALMSRLPRESFVYLGDTARLPYGTKSAETVRRYAVRAARFLVGQDIKVLVVACNTASSYALSAVRDAVPIPVIGVVEPGVDAVLATGARRVGIVGTEGTVRSGAYQDAIRDRAADVTCHAVPCPLFVPLAEEGWGDHPVTDEVASHYLRPLLDSRIEALILACTHYPILIPSLRRVVGPAVTLVDSATAVAAAVAGLDFARITAGGDATVHLQLTDASESFLRVARSLLEPLTTSVEVVHFA